MREFFWCARCSTEPKRGLTFLGVIKSVAAALIGVQSEANRKRDFTQDSWLPFVFAGILGVALFIGAVLLFVRWMIAGA